MFEKTKEVKVLRDPIHGYIHISDQLIWDCLNTKEFQRLRRIHQLGGVFQVYHTAEHSRFSHSLGVYEIARRLILENESVAKALDPYEKILVLCAALLHDLGHGPFSHFFESLQTLSHEERTISILQDSNSEIHKVLVKADPSLPDQIAKILRHEHPHELLNQLISSQLDCDRMDYLLRDAYETGTSYGKFDLERILRTLRVKEGRLCVKESGMHSVEDYIMARYHMYWQVYLHPDTKAYELLILHFFRRYRKQNEVIPILEAMRKDRMSNQEFFWMDENRCLTGIQEAYQLKDKILQDLARRILDRHLLAWIEDPNPQQEKQIQEVLRNFDPEYYYYEDIQPLVAYLPYQEKNTNQTIWVWTHQEKLEPLSKCSQIVKALLKMETTPHRRIYYAK